jgi:uncharacterized membrane protein YoaK (UPF0700 family)
VEDDVAALARLRRRLRHVDPRNLLAWTITVVWLAAVIVGAVKGSSTILAIVTPVMLVVAGFLFWRPEAKKEAT